jgi:uncharacterized lipoprotein YehR (DUF1307 family)
MKKIHLYTFIIALLALVVFASGCTSNNQTNQSTYGNYSVNGLSFNYPSNWLLTSQSLESNSVVVLYDPQFQQSNGTKGDRLEIVRQPKRANLTYDSVKTSLTNNTNTTLNTTDSKVNITGLTGNVTVFTGADTNGTQLQIKLIYFDKNNYTYILSFLTFGGVNNQDQQKYFDIIINSFQAP